MKVRFILTALVIGLTLAGCTPDDLPQTDTEEEVNPGTPDPEPEPDPEPDPDPQPDPEPEPEPAPEPVTPVDPNPGVAPPWRNEGTVTTVSVDDLPDSVRAAQQRALRTRGGGRRSGRGGR